MALLFGRGQDVKHKSGGFNSACVTPTVEDGVVLDVPVASFAFGMLEQEECSDFFGGIFSCGELGARNEGDVVRIGIAMSVLGEEIDGLSHRLPLDFAVLVVGVAILQMSCEDFDQTCSFA